MFFWTPVEQRRFSERTEQMVCLVGDLAATIRELKDVLGLVKAKRAKRYPAAKLVNGAVAAVQGGSLEGGDK
jgi:hypothetical protein